MQEVLAIPANSRVAVIGKTGSGKTFFSKHMLAKSKRLIVCDSKGFIVKDKEWDLISFKNGYKKLKDGQEARLIIPPLLDDEEWEHHFNLIYKLHNVIVYIDELYAVGPPQGSRGLRALYTRGRELGIGVWASTQRPSRIPLYALSEAETIVQFQLRLEVDKERMIDLIGERANYPLKDHSFILYSDKLDKTIGPLKLRVKKSEVMINQTR